ncbi:MAG: AbiH family protein [Flavobacteriaceae bacterium]|jgi:hypothetical protein
MNRIVLIGNGFDLAHGMKTSYNHFINDYWYNTIEAIKNIAAGRTFENDEILIKSCPPRVFIADNSFESLKKAIKEQNFPEIHFKNNFLKIITRKSYLNNWVDIENEYYFYLKEALGSNKNAYDVEQLNIDFKRIKELLCEYLIKVENDFRKNYGENAPRIKNVIGNKIYYPYKYKDLSEKFINKEFDVFKEYILKMREYRYDDVPRKYLNILSTIDNNNSFDEIRNALFSENSKDFTSLIPTQTLFLNFNYTSTDHLYYDPKNHNIDSANDLTDSKYMHIHGTTVFDDKNPIIFGYGDEIDEDYKTIEKLNDNRYLENIKSINYLETDNYKKLLDFVNSDDYQIFIFGHSCGVSDRTLLNTIFEHDNCASIKVFYHQKNENEDNYSDVIRNISRNFNDKAKMRDRVVNKMYCEPLS